MAAEEIRFEVENRTAILTLNRPDKLNALTPDMRNQMIEHMGRIDQDDDIRVAVVTGSGKAFCAGADLSSGGATFDYRQAGGVETSMDEHRDGGGKLSLAINNCRKPVIAAINGPAVGIGITMTLPMDMRVAAEDAKIGFVFARRGVTLEACSSWFLPRLVGMAKATELVYTGRVFKAAEEASSGLFNYVTHRDEVLPTALRLADEIAENTSAISVALSKALLWRGLTEPDPENAHLIESRCFYWAGRNQDAYEGVQSFLEKRPAGFSLKPSSDMPEFYPWWGK